MSDELTRFLDLELTVRNEYDKSNDSFKDKTLKIATLNKVHYEVLKHGKIPEELHITGNAPIKTELAEKVFENLNIPISTVIRRTLSKGRASVTFTFTR